MIAVVPREPILPNLFGASIALDAIAECLDASRPGEAAYALRAAAGLLAEMLDAENIDTPSLLLGFATVVAALRTLVICVEQSGGIEAGVRLTLDGHLAHVLAALGAYESGINA